jgi:hypothetical protein
LIIVIIIITLFKQTAYSINLVLFRGALCRAYVLLLGVIFYSVRITIIPVIGYKVAITARENGSCETASLV